MKQVLQFRRSGATRVVDVPAPMVAPGRLLVHNRWSLISPGTERMLATAGGGNLLNTARTRMGSSAFWAALRGYLTDNRYKLVGSETLLDALDDGTSLNLSSLFGPRFPGLY